jgi:hypothetical protein
MYCAEQSKREAEYRHRERLRRLRNVRKSTLARAFMDGESVFNVARRYGIEMSDVENAIRALLKPVPR